MAALPRIRRSTLDIGSAFEKHALRFCNEQLHMSLRRVGGAGDGGVDLRGHWWIPSDSRPTSSTVSTPGIEQAVRRLRVVAQCKAERKALGPRAVRELEGVIAHLQGASRKGKEPAFGHEDTIALLLSQSGFSKNAMTHASGSQSPLLLVHLPGGLPIGGDQNEDAPGNDSQDILVDGAWWNNALAGREGVLGGRMELRREILSGSTPDPITRELKVKTRVGIWYKGGRLKSIKADSKMDSP